MQRSATERPHLGQANYFGKEHTGDFPDTPAPDYDLERCIRQRRNSAKFLDSFKNVISNIHSIEDLYSHLPEPAPDYTNDDDNDDFPPPPPPVTAEDLSAAVEAAYDSSVHNGSVFTAEGGPTIHARDQGPPQILPKPLPNPCIESRERQALHKELLLNYKIGKDVLKKPELNKVLRERRETQKRKEWVDYHNSKGRTSLELKLEERASKMKEDEEKTMQVINEEEKAPELLRMHRRITHKAPNTENGN